MKKLIYIFLAVILALTVMGAEAETETEYTPSMFLGFDDGELPVGFTPNSSMKMMEGDTALVNDGILRSTVTTDPYASFTTKFFYSDYSEIRIRMKHNTPGHTDCFTQVFFSGTLADGNSFGYSQTYSIKQVIGESTSDYVTHVLDLSSVNALTGAVITGVRFDFVSHAGDIYIDYIQLVPENPSADIVYTFDSAIAPWGSMNAKDVTVSNGILTGTTTGHNGLISNSTLKFLGATYPTVYVRMMFGEEGTGNNGVPSERDSLFYTNLVDEEGTVIKPLYTQYGGYNYASNKILKSDNGKYKVYTYDFSKYSEYLNNSVSQMAFNMVNIADVKFGIDTVLFKNPDSLEWNFECEGLTEGWTVSDTDFAVTGGKLKYTHNSTTWKDPRINISGLSLDGDNIAGLEVIMKHEITDETKETSDVRIYYSGTREDGSTFANTMKRVFFNGKSSGDNYAYYYIDLTTEKDWVGSTINYIRIDPINEIGNVEVDSIRFISTKKGMALDDTLMSLTYDFENTEKGYADGTITLDFGDQDANIAKRVNLYWANGNKEDGYTILPDYTVIKSDAGIAFKQPLVINKELLIPEEATALLAKVTDGVRTFDLVCEIPESKLPEPFGEPLYTAYFASDFHLGGWGSNPNPNVRQAAARTNIMESGAEFLVVSGDICQWYGEIAKSDEWRFATEYFKEFEMPVYMVKGNHDEPNYPSGYVMPIGYKYFSYDFFDSFLYDWIKYSEEKDYYTVDRIPGEDYYHTEIHGHHYIFLSVPDLGYYAFGDEQLEWFENILYENEESGKPIFVFGHVPANGKLNFQIGTTRGTITDFEKFEAILNRHPSAIYTSGDSHYTLNTFLINVNNGKGELPSYMNDGAVIEAVKSVNEAVPYSSLKAIEGHNAMGVLALVYEDRVLLRARDFMNNKWISIGLSHVTFKEKCPIPEFTVKDENGTLTVENPVENITYTWYINGDEAGAGSSITLEKDFVGFVAVRATDASGNYRSELIDTYKKKYPDFAVLHVSDTEVTVENVKSSGYVCLVSYENGKMLDTKLVPAITDTVINIADTGLDMTNADTVKAFFIDKTPLKPLGFSAIRYMK